MLVLPAEAGTQRLKSLDPGQKHAGMTIKWDSSGVGATLVANSNNSRLKPLLHRKEPLRLRALYVYHVLRTEQLSEPAFIDDLNTEFFSLGELGTGFVARQQVVCFG